MKYPNVAAECQVSGYPICIVSDHTLIDKSLLEALLFEDTEEDFTYDEARALCGLFEAPPDYLFAPVLSTLSSNRKKRARKYALLRALVDDVTGGARVSESYLKEIEHAKAVLHDMESGRPVIYTRYRWAVKRMRQIRDVHDFCFRSRREKAVTTA